MRYGITVECGGWVVRHHIIGHNVTAPVTSEEVQQAVARRLLRERIDGRIGSIGWARQGAGIVILL
jgi:hypothetical protein